MRACKIEVSGHPTVGTPKLWGGGRCYKKTFKKHNTSFDYVEYENSIPRHPDKEKTEDEQVYTSIYLPGYDDTLVYIAGYIARPKTCVNFVLRKMTGKIR